MTSAQATARSPVSRPNRVSSTSLTLSGVERRPERGAGGGRRLQDDGGRAGQEAGEGRGEQERTRSPGEALRGPGPLLAAAAVPAQRRPPDEQQEAEQPDPEADRRIAEPARRPVGDRGHGAGVGVVEKLGDRLGRPGPGLANGEDEAARDRMRIGGDDAVGGRVGPVAEPGIDADGDGVTSPLGLSDLAAFDLLALGVEDANRAEAGLDRLAEEEGDLLRRRLKGGAALAAPCARAARGRSPFRAGAPARRRRGQAARRDHQASFASWSSRAGAPRRRRRMTRIAAAPTRATAPRAKNGGAGKPSSWPTQ